jgi:hypothetical protein
MMSNQVILANNSSIRLDKKRKETAASAGIANDRLVYEVVCRYKPPFPNSPSLCAVIFCEIIFEVDFKKGGTLFLRVGTHCSNGLRLNRERMLFEILPPRSLGNPVVFLRFSMTVHFKWPARTTSRGHPPHTILRKVSK